MNGLQKIPLKHYLYLILWGGSMFLACTPGFGWLWGLLFLFIFFLVTTFKVMKKLILIFVLTFILGGILLNFLGEFAAVILTILPLVSILMKINFLRKNWKALRLGLYAYFGYIIIMAIAGTFGATLPVIGMFIGAFIFTVIFHKLLINLYRAGYDTDKAFSIIGLTPIILISFLLPFLKIDIEGLEIFHGSVSDYAGIDIHEHVIPKDIRIALKIANLADFDVDVDLNDATKLSGVDINDVINVPAFSHALEAAFAYSAAYGVFKVSSYEKEYSIRNSDGTVEIISPEDDFHSIIKDQDGNQIGDIYLDRLNGIEIVKLSDGFIYVVNQSTGNVFDVEGKLLGKITEDAHGNKIFSDKNGKIIRKFKADGLIFDGNDIEIGCAAV